VGTNVFTVVVTDNGLPPLNATQSFSVVVMPPTNSPPSVASTLTLSNLNGNPFRFTLLGTVGSNYIVQAATDLARPVWLPLVTNAAPFEFVESDKNEFPQRFYRAIVAP
jgi:hypothetical protein